LPLVTKKQEQVAAVDILVELFLPAVAGVERQNILKELRLQNFEHLHALEDLFPILRGVDTNAYLYGPA
jgi:hypothetical protein